MMKKIALLCALAMLVSVIPSFAATGDTPIKTQSQLQQKVKDCKCTNAQAKDQTKTQKRLHKKTKDCNCNKVNAKTQKRLHKHSKDGSKSKKSDQARKHKRLHKNNSNR